MDCSVLVRQPQPTMTVAECERRKSSYGQLDAAVRAPGGERQGDEAMTCAEVIAEMQSMRFVCVTADTARASIAAGNRLRAAYGGGTSAAAAMGARHSAETMAVATMPNAVQGAVMYRHAAEQAALGRANNASMAKRARAREQRHQ